jgi:hypothetical protein
MSTQVIEKVLSHAQRIAAGEHEKVKPGMPFRLTTAAQPGDAVWQGDLCIEVVAKVPDGYKLSRKPAVQLVPGTTQGARHCLDSLQGVKVYYPANWPNVEETLLGPCLVLFQERNILHPTHGAITIPAGFTILCSYQRDYDYQTRQTRRTQD